MKQPTHLATLLLISLLSVSSSFSSSSADDSSVYETFLECLRSNIGPQDQTSLTNLLYTRSNTTSYTKVLSAYLRNLLFSKTSTPKPLLIFTPTKVPHVQAAVVCTKKMGYQLKIRSGGHDFEGISYVSDTPFFILDMFNLGSIRINIANEVSWVQSGAILGEVYYKIWQKSRVHGFAAGVCPTVGVGGHLSGGGYGNLLRKYGLSIDNVVDAQIVDVHGRLLDRRTMGEDLFWAIRGGGGASFGVIVSYKIKLVRVPERVTVFSIKREQDEGSINSALDVAYKWQFVAPETTPDLFLRMLLQPVTSTRKKGEKTVRTTVMALYLGSSDTLVSLMAKEFGELGLKKEDCTEMSWIESVVWWANYNNGSSPDLLLGRNTYRPHFFKRKSDYVQNPISKDGLKWIFDRLIELSKTGLVFNPYGGKMSEIPESDAPFPHRAGNLYKIQYSTGWDVGTVENEKDCMDQIRKLYSYMTPFVSKNPRSAYLNYRDLDIGVMVLGKHSLEYGKVYGYKYFKGNFDRLVKVKTAVDPENFFWNEQSIPTLH